MSSEFCNDVKKLDICPWRMSRMKYRRISKFFWKAQDFCTKWKVVVTN
jgi:hypothetical protein